MEIEMESSSTRGTWIEMGRDSRDFFADYVVLHTGDVD